MSLNGKKFLDNLQQLQSTDKVRSFFEYFSEAIAEKYARKLAVVVRETRESLQDVIADLARRFRFAQDHFEVDPVTLIRFFESEEYWNFQYSSTADHVEHTHASFPSPHYYPARQCIDYALFPTYRLRKQEILRQIQATRGPSTPKNVLEVGVGSGELIGELLKLFKECNGVGLDVIQENIGFSNAWIASLNARGRFTGMNLDVQQDIPTCEDGFDLVVCSEVLEHLEDPQTALENMRRSMKRDAIAILTVPLEDPGHEHLQCFQKGDIEKIVPGNMRVMKSPIHNWEGTMINQSPDGESCSEQKVIHHQLMVLQAT